MSRSADVRVIGGGIVGLATAWELVQRGMHVEVFDAPAGSRQASWAGGGILSDLPPGSADVRLKALLDDSLARYPLWCETLREASGIDPQYWRCGARVDGDWHAEIAQVRNPRLLKALRQALRFRGVAIHARPAEPDASVITVIAAGAWSAQLLPQLPVLPVKGEMLLYQARPGLLNHIVLHDDFYLVPRRDGRILAGSTVEASDFDPLPTVSARALLHRRACRLLPALASASIENHWVGLRPGSPHGLPIIGAVKGATNLYCNTGHFRLGITLAPASAARVVDAITAHEHRLSAALCPLSGPAVSGSAAVAK